MHAPAPIGHNQPPGPIEQARESLNELGTWMLENPVIQSATDAKNGGGYVERTRLTLAELEAERTVKVGPLNKELSAINSAYRTVREPLEGALKELRRRLTKYASDLEAERAKEALRLREEAEAKEAAARAAEAAEQNAIACADVGECTDVAGAIAEADAKFSEFKKADHAAAVAARDVPARIGSVMGGRSLAMRTTRKLVVDDAAKAVTAIGLTDKLRTAIVQCAKDFEQAHGELPAGVSETWERTM